jgi:hypothetical protein
MKKNKMDNLEVKLRELRLKCECGAYTIENNGVWESDSKTFLRDVLNVLNNATRTIGELLQSDEVSDDTLAELLWDAEIEGQLFEYRRIKRG